METKKRLAIFTTTIGGKSDTFIQAHIQKLEEVKKVFYGFPMPIFDSEKVNKKESIPKWKKILPAFLYFRLIKPKSDLEIIEQNLITSNINIVLAEYGHVACKILPVCKKLNIPMIVHFHGHDAYRNTILNEFGNQFKELFEYAKCTISVSKNMTNQLIKLGANPQKVLYNPYGPNELFFNIQPDYRKKTCIAVGRFVEKKAPYLTLIAFQKVQEKHPDAELIFIGDGELLSTCKNIAKSMEIKNVIFTGALDHQQTVQYFSKASCYIQHSIVASDGDSEGTPVAILEAGAAGLPIVSTNHAGIPDVIIDGITGFLVNEFDINAMAEKLSILLDDEALRKSMGLKSRERIKKDFLLKKHIDTLQSIVAN